MNKSYDIEVPAIAETAVTGVALLVADTIRGHRWHIACDNAGRPLAITRDGKPYPTLPNLLRPIHKFAVRFLTSMPE